jgi:hypothetical protein
VVYWCNSYTIVHCSLDIIEWFKYKLKKVFKLYLILIHPPLSINKEEYNSHLTQCRMDHSKFENLEENLKGATLVEHLIIDFEILNQFKIVNIGLPVMTYASCIDIQILIKEIMSYDIPLDLQWKEIVGLGKTECNFLGSNV